MGRKIGEGFSPQQIGGIVTAIKRGDASYTYFAKKYHTSTGRIRRLCKNHGVSSIYSEPEQLKQSRHDIEKPMSRDATFWIGLIFFIGAALSINYIFDLAVILSFYGTICWLVVLFYGKFVSDKK